MIPTDFVLSWKKQAPWGDNDFVEQDLVISRALVESSPKSRCSKLLPSEVGQPSTSSSSNQPAAIPKISIWCR